MVPTKPASPKAGAEVSVQAFSDDALRNLSSMGDIASLLGNKPLTTADELGNGFVLVDSDEKDRLCGVPLVFLEWSIHTGDYGLFVSALVVEIDRMGNVKNKYIVNDGSMKKGVAATLAALLDKGQSTGLFAPNGLRASRYTYDDGDGPKPAVSYHIDTTPAK